MRYVEQTMGIPVDDEEGFHAESAEPQREGGEIESASRNDATTQRIVPEIKWICSNVVRIDGVDYEVFGGRGIRPDSEFWQWSDVVAEYVRAIPKDELSGPIQEVDWQGDKTMTDKMKGLEITGTEEVMEGEPGEGIRMGGNLESENGTELEVVKECYLEKHVFVLANGQKVVARELPFDDELCELVEKADQKGEGLYQTKEAVKASRRIVERALSYDQEPEVIRHLMESGLLSFSFSGITKGLVCEIMGFAISGEDGLKPEENEEKGTELGDGVSGKSVTDG